MTGPSLRYGLQGAGSLAQSDRPCIMAAESLEPIASVLPSNQLPAERTPRIDWDRLVTSGFFVGVLR